MNIPVTACPSCKRDGFKADLVDAKSDYKGHPEEGDVTICMECGYVMEFAADLSLREITNPDKRLDVLDHPMVQATLGAIREMQRERRKLN